MDALPITKPRSPTGPMGCLNYPPEIMNQIYHELFVDDSQVLCFLCSTDPALNTITLRQAVDTPQTSSDEELDWTHLYDDRYYVESKGLSAQFLSVCKSIWGAGTAVLYANLTIAMRWTPKPDPCLAPFFKTNTPYVLAFAKVIYPRYSDPWPLICREWNPFNILHWGVAHPSENWDMDRQILRRVREKRLSETGRKSLGIRVRSASF